MNQLRLLGILLKPSLFGFIFATFIASTLLLINNAQHLLGSKLLNTWLGADQSQLTMLLAQLESSLNVPDIDLRFLDVPAAYNVVVIIAAVISGFLVYIALETFSRSAGNVHEAVEEVRFAKDWNTKEAIGVGIGARLTLRLGAVMGWITYMTFWSNFVFPYCVALSRIGLDEPSTLAATGFISAGLILLALSLHLHIVFMRLILLKPRIFGGKDIIASELYE